jgi:hypothetical protein
MEGVAGVDDEDMTVVDVVNGVAGMPVVAVDWAEANAGAKAEAESASARAIGAVEIFFICMYILLSIIY